jgi:hypothetical protein
MVARELARRQEGDGTWPTLCFIVDDKCPGALTNVEAAVKAIVEQAEQGNIAERVSITSNVHEAVLAALRAAYPRRFILVRTFADSPSQRGRPPNLRRAVLAGKSAMRGPCPRGQWPRSSVGAGCSTGRPAEGTLSLRAAAGLDGELASATNHPHGFQVRGFGSDIPTGLLCYNTFLPFLSQMADSRAFEPAVILIIELPSGLADSP